MHKNSRFYMNLAKQVAEHSVCERRHVGCVIVKDDVIMTGYNHMPYGGSTECEIDGVSKLDVIHAEMDAIAKMARQGMSTKGAVMYVTHCPCIHCAKLIYSSGITEVYYMEKTDSSLMGYDFMVMRGIILNKILV